jgi:3-hydroxybutyryl-CoA dehydrogenase
MKVGSVVDIDQSMKLGANHAMGPLELADFIGLDTCLAIMNVLHSGLADQVPALPAAGQIRRIRAGGVPMKMRRNGSSIPILRSK